MNDKEEYSSATLHGDHRNLNEGHQKIAKWININFWIAVAQAIASTILLILVIMLYFK